jgi:uncharacterized membrane-anchored protein
LNRFRELQETLIRASGKDDPDTTSILTEIQQITNQLLESQKKSTTTNNNSGDEPSSTTASNFNSSEPMQSNVAVNENFPFSFLSSINFYCRMFWMILIMVQIMMMMNHEHKQHQIFHRVFLQIISNRQYNIFK